MVDPPPTTPALLAERQGTTELYSAGYWRRICPQLHVSDAKFQRRARTPFQLPRALAAETRRRINTDGFTQVPASELPWAASMDDLALGVRQLQAHGWPGAFLSMYDEAWALCAQIGGLMKAATGNENNMDMLSWLVDPNRDQAGFSPHRDRQPDDSPSTFRADGTAKYTTCWIPFTDAVPDNSCLYVLPRQHDPGYFEGDRDDGPDPLTVALGNKEAYQNIRAIPAKAGSATIFTHRIIHWGSRGREGYPTPRISFSFGAASDDYEPPYFSREHLPFPAMHLRAGLACAQMVIYHERFPFSRKLLSLFSQVIKAETPHLDPEYARKVRFELVGAFKDLATRGGEGEGAEGSEEEEEEEEGQDLDDQVLDAMLEAKMAGEGDGFEDDFDDFEEGEAADDSEDDEGEEVGNDDAWMRSLEDTRGLALGKARWGSGGRRGRAANGGTGGRGAPGGAGARGKRKQGGQGKGKGMKAKKRKSKA